MGAQYETVQPYLIKAKLKQLLYDFTALSKFVEYGKLILGKRLGWLQYKFG